MKAERSEQAGHAQTERAVHSRRVERAHFKMQKPEKSAVQSGGRTGSKMSEQKGKNNWNVFEDMQASQRALLELLGRLDNTRGCFAKRDTLVQMFKANGTPYSIHTVNINISKLKRAGFITSTTRGRRRDEPAIIRLTPRGKALLRAVQTEYKQSGPHDRSTIYIKPVHNKVAREQATLSQPDSKKRVVSPSRNLKGEEKPKPTPRLTEAQRKKADQLTTAGVTQAKASEIVLIKSTRAIDKAFETLHSYRDEIWNPGGFLVQALEFEWYAGSPSHHQPPRAAEPSRQEQEDRSQAFRSEAPNPHQIAELPTNTWTATVSQPEPVEIQEYKKQLGAEPVASPEFAKNLSFPWSRSQKKTVV